MLPALHTTTVGAQSALVCGGPLAGWLLWVALGRHRSPLRVVGTEALPAGVHLVLAQVTGTEENLRQIGQLAEIAAEQQKSLLLVYVVPVPRRQPFGLPGPGAKLQAEAALEQARQAAAAQGAAVRTLAQPGRRVWPALMLAARREGAGAIMAAPRRSRRRLL